MTTCRDVIKTALRKCAVLQSGRDPSGAQSADGLAALQSLYTGWVHSGSFGRLCEYIAAADYTAKEQQRILNTTFTITLPASVVDHFTGCTRPPYDLALVEVVKAATAPQTSIYDAMSGAWVRLDGLALTDQAPLSNRDSDGLASCLTRVLADEFGAPLGTPTLTAAARFESRLTRKASSPERPVGIDYF